MPSEKIERWTCDLCGKKREVEIGKKPKGWAQLSLEDPHIDRSWIKKCICDSCTEGICRDSKQP